MTCDHETLASSGPFQVQRCLRCGGMSVHMGATTVRLDEAALKTLQGVLREALDNCGHAALEPTSTWSELERLRRN